MRKLISIFFAILMLSSGLILLDGVASGSAPPTGTNYYIPITLYNNQTTATVSNFDQMLTINWSDYSSYLNSNVSNVRFYSSSSLDSSYLLPGWIESGNTTTTTNSTVWVNLTSNTISASGTLTIYMAFLPTTSSWNSTYWGLAPQLSTTYGQFDNGAHVFTNYWNFKGTSLPNGWSSSTDFTGSVNNGVTITSSSQNAGIYTQLSIPNNIATDLYGLQGSENSFHITYGSAALSSGTYGQYFGSGYLYDHGTGSSGFNIQVETAETTFASGGFPLQPSYYELSMIWQGSKFISQANYSNVISGTDSTYSSESYLGIAVYQGETFTVYWTDMRTPPPSNVMPATSFRAVQQAVQTYTLSFHSTGLPSGTNVAITVNGTEVSSTSGYNNFSLANGTYSYTILTNVTGYFTNTTSGTITINGENVSETIKWYPSWYHITFSETGFSYTGVGWEIKLTNSTSSLYNNVTSGTSSYLNISKTSQGSYTYYITSYNPNYSPSPSTGTIDVVWGSPQNIITNISFTFRYVPYPVPQSNSPKAEVFQSSTLVSLNITDIVPINLTNPESSATSTNQQVYVEINWSNYTQYLSSDHSNVRMSSSETLTPSSKLYSWIQGSDVGQKVWINLGNETIPADGSLIIYMMFLPIKTNDWGPHWGYQGGGSNDNGANVFSYYNTLTSSSGFSIYSKNGGGASFGSEGVHFYASDTSGSNVVVLQQSFSTHYIWEDSANISQVSALSGGLLAPIALSLTSNAQSVENGTGNGYTITITNMVGGTVGSNTKLELQTINQASTGSSNTITNTVLNGVGMSDTSGTYSLYWPSTGSETGTLSLGGNGANTSISSSDSTYSTGTYYVAIIVYNYGYGGTFTGLRAIQPPPSNVFPTYRFESSVSEIINITSGVANNFTGTLVSSYNNTYSYYTYNIPLFSSTQTFFFVMNSSWILNNVYAQSYTETNYSLTVKSYTTTNPSYILYSYLPSGTVFITGTSIGGNTYQFTILQPTPNLSREVESYVSLNPPSAVNFLAGALISPNDYQITATTITSTGNEYPIQLSPNSTSSNSYQQFLQLNQDGKSINNQFSNIKFYSGTTELYAWIQSINGSPGSETASIWINIPTETSQTIDLYVYPTNYSFLGTYLGKAGTSTDNFLNVFPNGFTNYNYAGTYVTGDFTGLVFNVKPPINFPANAYFQIDQHSTSTSYNLFIKNISGEITDGVYYTGTGSNQYSSTGTNTLSYGYILSNLQGSVYYDTNNVFRTLSYNGNGQFFNYNGGNGLNITFSDFSPISVLGGMPEVTIGNPSLFTVTSSTSQTVQNGRFTATLGDTYNIVVKDTFGDVIGSLTTTITKPYQTSLVNVSIYPVTFTNINATETSFTIEHNNITKELFYLGYDQSYIVWIGSGEYNFTVSPVNKSSTDYKININSMSYILSDGPLLQDISANISSVNTTLYTQGKQIYNQTYNGNLNSTQRYLQEVNSGSYSYQFVPKNATLVANGMDITLWITGKGGNLIDNASLSYLLWKNLSLEYVNLSSQYNVTASLLSYGPHSITIKVVLNQSQIQTLQTSTSGAEVSLYSPFTTGSVQNIALGSINPTTTNIQNVTGIWAFMGFSSNPPYSIASAQFILWFMEQPTGRAIVELIVLIGAVFELIFYINARNRIKTSAKFKAIYDKVGTQGGR